MRLGGRIQAAAEVLEDILERRTPAAMALRDWGKSHRFAGSKDRSAIGNFVHDALRRKSSIGYRMNDNSPRALALGAAVFSGGITVEEILEQTEGDQHFGAPLTEDQIAKLRGQIELDTAPEWVRADVPEWIWPAFETNFDEEAIVEGAALTNRPPLDIRVNAIKATRDSVDVKDATPTEISPIGLRLAPVAGQGRHPNVQSDPDFMTGKFDIQDEGSQIVSLLVAAKAGEQVLDYCAGGGGKSLAMAADMENEGAVYAFDIDKRRLAPTYDRSARAGASIIKVVQPPEKSLNNLRGNMDRVLVDAPCTGVGTWRRKPDAKWRLSEDSLVKRVAEQKKVLDNAKDFVKPGGYLFYVTCSMLAAENEHQVYSFLDRAPEFALLSAGEVWEDRFGVDVPKPWSADGCTLTLTPASTNTDGFFFAVMERTT
ncbi:RsmB/NOP family class I SAM-dependent RNA methyltransferase [Litorimonas sp. WD9-15]|uniref:RsmB/NOP family class I SAM-dependent RNA methyltransferase n=1 Tax=Litorimonas sp. WD9-15 TaxID=3418716 RepID=UPI003D0019E2